MPKAIRQGTPPPLTYSLRTRCPGPLGATRAESIPSGGMTWPKWMLNPCEQSSRLPFCRFGRISVRNRSPCTSSGNRMLTMSAALVASAAEMRLKAVADGQFVVRAAWSLTDDHLAAAVAEVLCVGVSLAAVAQNGDRFVLEQRQVGIVFVVNFGGHNSCLCVEDLTALRRGIRDGSTVRRTRASGPIRGVSTAGRSPTGPVDGKGRRPGAWRSGPVRTISRMPNGRICSMNASILLSRPEISTITCSGLTSTMRARKISLRFL